jgi:hypothetical protein
MVNRDIAEALVSTDELKPLLCREQHPGRSDVAVTAVDQLLPCLFLCSHQDSKVAGPESSFIDDLLYLLLRVKEDDHANVVVLRRSEERPEKVDDGLGLTDPRI